MSFQTVYDFNYSGNSIKFKIPSSCKYMIECWGAAGASRNAAGGKGGYACGKYEFKAGQEIQINVGGAGSGNIGGFNGGGRSWSQGGGGGGASDIRINNFSLNDRIIVAGGGGGAQAGYGGYGGGLVGGSGQDRFGSPGYGGTQTSGGGGPMVGSFGQGANASTGSDGNYGGAGGGGWYGGGGGNSDGSAIDDSGGGGGSSYIALLEDGVTYAGNQSMPNPNADTIMTGNSSHGHIRITIIELNITYYSILENDKYYIPTSNFYDGQNFIPVTKEFLTNKLNYDKFLYDISLINRKTILEKFDFKKIKIVKFIRRHIVYMDKIETFYTDFNNYIKNISFNYDPIKDYLLKGNIIINIINDNNLDYNIIKNIGTNNIKVGISNSKYIYGKDMCKITKDEILDKGIDINDLKNYIIPFDEYKIIICFTNGIEELKEIKQVGLDLYKYKKISDDYLNITTDYKDIYISPTKNINKMLINKLSNYENKNAILERVY